MAKPVRQVAQLCMDAFYQEFRPSDGFLRLEHFIWLCTSADSKIKQDEYNAQVALNIRMRILHSSINMSAENYEVVTVKLKGNSIELPNPIMSFSGDSSSIGVSLVEPVDGGCAPFMRIGVEEKWTVCNIKDTVFWYPLKDKIEFINIGEVCSPEEIRVTYIPVLSKEGNIQDARVWPIINLVNAYIKSAKDGVIVDFSNDGNSNVATQTEINKYLLKALQGG